MDAKEYLLQIKRIETRIKNIDEEIERLHSEIITIRSAWPDGQPHGSGKSDPVGDLAVKLVVELEEIETKQLILRGNLWRTRNEIITTLGKLEHAEHNRLLYLRYVKGEQWERIALDMHYSYQWVCGVLHDNALQALQETLDRN